MKNILLKIQRSETLSREEMENCMRNIMEGHWEDTQIAAFLMGLSLRGETVDEITGAAKIMREKALHINAPANAVDCCGTGGDGQSTYNISTAVAILGAACGVPMAKHGNRAASSKSGAADVLESLGANLDCTKEKLEKALQRYNFAFLMAPKHHSAMKYVVPVRKALGVRTIFNLLGPLANPAGTKRQLIGVYDPKWLTPFAHALKNLGTEKAWIVCGENGMDEITTTGKTHLAILENGQISERTLTPADFGLSISNIEDLRGGDAQTNANALKAILSGQKNAYRDIVLANTAAVLMIAEKCTNLKEGVKLASDTLDSGKALETLNAYIAFTRSGAPT